MKLCAAVGVAVCPMGAGCRAAPSPPSSSAKPVPCPPRERASSNWVQRDGLTGVEARITDPATGRPVRMAHLVAYPLDSSANPPPAAADSLGRARLDSLRPGRYDVRARAIGYEASSDTLVVTTGRRSVGEVQLPVAKMWLSDCVRIRTHDWPE